MSKKEYLDRLRELLSFELPERLVKKNIDFYENYFDEQIREGKKQDEICEELGDPQLIAKSCIDAETAGADGIPNSGDEVDYSEEIAKEKQWKSFGNHASSKEESRSFDENGNNADPKQKTTVISSKAGCLVAVLLILGLLALLVAFFSTSLGSAILTVIVGGMILSGIIKLFRRF